MGRGLYVHFPFCQNKCSYCDFYKELHDSSLENQFFDALKLEIDLVAAELPESERVVNTVYIGGGTPSLANLDLLADFMGKLKRLFHVPPAIEFSLELNPETVHRDAMILYKLLGVTRPVFGIQSFETKLLKTLGRVHEPKNSHHAIYLANVLGFDNFGVDLIYGMPGQTSRLLSSDLDQLIDLEPPHISFYELTVEDGTALAGQVAKDELKMPDTELVTAMYRGGCERMSEGGYKRYEVCSFAKTGYECRHNMNYWEGGEYIGLGPSAHSFMYGRRFNNVPNVIDYMKSLEEGRRPTVEDDSGPKERMAEAIMLGLRMSQGIDRSVFKRRFDCDLTACVDRDQLQILVDSGHVVMDKRIVKLSDAGIYVADEIARRLLK